MSLAKRVGERLAEAEEKSVAQHVDDGLCQWEGGGKCFYPGNCSHSIRGGGPYFCLYHMRESHPETASRIAEESKQESNRKAYYPPSIWDKIDEELKRLPKKQPARKAREPGDDDEELAA